MTDSEKINTIFIPRKIFISFLLGSAICFVTFMAFGRAAGGPFAILMMPFVSLIFTAKRFVIALAFGLLRAALNSRKEHKPKNNAIDLAEEIGIEILNEEQYRELQKLGEFDLKTSSWIQTPSEIRKLGGALFCDRRFNTVFVYHNGAESYYAARGFRGILKV